MYLEDFIQDFENEFYAIENCGMEFDYMNEKYDEMICDIFMMEAVRDIAKGVGGAIQSLVNSIREFLKNMMDFVNKYVRGHLDNLQVIPKEDSDGEVFLFYYNNVNQLVKKQPIEANTDYEFVKCAALKKLIENNTVKLVALYKLNVSVQSGEAEDKSDPKSRSGDEEVNKAAASQAKGQEAEKGTNKPAASGGASKGPVVKTESVLLEAEDKKKDKDDKGDKTIGTVTTKLTMGDGDGDGELVRESFIGEAKIITPNLATVKSQFKPFLDEIPDYNICVKKCYTMMENSSRLLRKFGYSLNREQKNAIKNTRKIASSLLNFNRLVKPK